MPEKRASTINEPKGKTFCKITCTRPTTEEEREEVQELLAIEKVRVYFLLESLCLFYLMLLIAAGIISLIYFTDLAGWVKKNYWYWGIICSLHILIILILLSCGHVRYKCPWNVLFLIFVTPICGLFLGGIASYLDFSTFKFTFVMLCVGNLTLIINGVIPPKAVNICFNLWSLIVFGLIYIALARFLFSFTISSIIIPWSVCLLLLTCVVIDMTLITYGVHFYLIKPGETILAATHLYVDSYFFLIVIFNLLKVIYDAIYKCTKNDASHHQPQSISRPTQSKK